MKPSHFLTIAMIAIGGTLTSQFVLSYSTGGAPGHGSIGMADDRFQHARLTADDPRLGVPDRHDAARKRYQPDSIVVRHYSRLSEEKLNALGARIEDGAPGQRLIDQALTQGGSAPAGNGITYHF
ncbi:MAG: hypothetical protein ACQEUN_06345 [Pseudomonadota bacterium]